MNKQYSWTDVISPKEAEGLLSLVALNRLLHKNEIRKIWDSTNWRISFRWRSKKNLWGRFGGGWNWALGFMKSGRTILLYLLICSISISKKRRSDEKP